MREEAEKVIENKSEKNNLVEERFAYMRYAGQGHEIKVPIENNLLSIRHLDSIKSSFEQKYEKLYSRILPNADIEILTWSLSLSIQSENENEYKELNSYTNREESTLVDFIDYHSEKKIKVPYFERNELNPGDLIMGQCIISEDQTTIIVSKNFNTKVLGNNFLKMEYNKNE